jgi:hypothetical protein
MIPENQDDSSELLKASLKTWAEMSQVSLGMVYGF